MTRHPVFHVRCLLLAVVVLFGLLTGQDASGATDTTQSAHKFYIGYDRGLSLRLVLRGATALGLIVTPNSSNSLYYQSSQENQENMEDYHYTNAMNRREKGATLLLEATHRLKYWGHFTLSPFISVGLGYSDIYFEQENQAYNSSSDSTRSYGYSTHENNVSLIGRIGLMPGFQYGPFTVELRLGLGGEVSRSNSPENDSKKSKSNSKRLFVIYPVDIVKQIVVHFALF